MGRGRDFQGKKLFCDTAWLEKWSEVLKRVRIYFQEEESPKSGHGNIKCGYKPARHPPPANKICLVFYIFRYRQLMSVHPTKHVPAFSLAISGANVVQCVIHLIAPDLIYPRVEKFLVVSASESLKLLQKLANRTNFYIIIALLGYPF